MVDAGSTDFGGSQIKSQKIQIRMKPNHLEPTDSEMETVLQEPVQETNDPEWQKVETKKTREMKNKEKNGLVQTKQRSRRPCVFVIKPRDGKTYADVLSKVKKDTTLQDVGLAVATVRKTLSGDILFILNKDNQGKATEIGQKISTVLDEDETINARIQEIALDVTRLTETITKNEVYQAVMRELGYRFKSI